MKQPYQLVRKNLPALDYEPHRGDTERIITVRLPLHVHRQVQSDAHDARTSMNLFCLSKLIAAIPDCPIVPERKTEQIGFATIRSALLLGDPTDEAGRALPNPRLP